MSKFGSSRLSRERTESGLVPRCVKAPGPDAPLGPAAVSSARAPRGLQRLPGTPTHPENLAVSRAYVFIDQQLLRRRRGPEAPTDLPGPGLFADLFRPPADNPKSVVSSHSPYSNAKSRKCPLWLRHKQRDGW